jgi:uncharacterized protein YndB with AHSA1/START domain
MLKAYLPIVISVFVYRQPSISTRRAIMKSSTLLLAMAFASLMGNSRTSLASVVRTSIVSMAPSERAVRVEARWSQSPEITWKYFATEEGLRCWAAPVIRLDLRIGGSLQSNYSKTAAIGDPGTISLGIINYVENEIMTYKVKLNDQFSAQLRSQDENLQEIVELQRLPNGGTRLVSTMVGWGKGAEWDKAAAFFAKGNEWSYKQLAKCVESSQ